MIGTIDVLPCADSPLRRLDPRWKLAALLVAAVAIVLLSTLLPAMLGLAVAVMLAGVGNVPRRWALTRLGFLALVLAPFLLVLPLIHTGGPVLTLGPLTLALDGVWAACLLIAKTLTLFLLMLVLLTSAPLPDTLKAAESLGVPGVLVQLALLTYRYVFVLAGELGRLRVALRVRGYRNRATLHSYRTVGHVAGMLLVRGAERAERIGQAMRCRGFDGHFRSLNDFRTRFVDVAFFGATMAAAFGLVVWDLTRR
jgi:cobalt/nickel transport system permease protein